MSGAVAVGVEADSALLRLKPQGAKARLAKADWQQTAETGRSGGRGLPFLHALKGNKTSREVLSAERSRARPQGHALKKRKTPGEGCLESRVSEQG